MTGELRPFDPVSDAVHVAELWRTSLEPTWPLLPAAIASQRQGLISMAGDEVTGFIGFDLAGSIPLILVPPAWQRRGVGGALMTAALQALRAAGVGAVSAASGGEFNIWPGVPRDLPAAVSFFGSQGWRYTEDTLDLVADLDGYEAPRDLTRVAPVTLSVVPGPERQHVLDFEEANFPSWTRWFRDERQDVLLARAGDGRIAGTLLFAGPGADSVFAPMLGPALGIIGCVGVAREWQDRASGTAMVVRASELLRDAGTRLCHIGWTVRESFYVRAGYRPWRRYDMFRLDPGRP